ncbi:MAG: TolC family protein, partial [Elusimicrobiota bacterium]
GAEEKNFMLSQEIPFPAKLHLRKRVALKAAAMAEQGYLAKIRDVLARVRSIYAMLYLSHKNLELFNENIELLRRFAKVAESKYAAGRASQSDVLKAHVELSKMLNMLVVVNQDKEAAGFMLNALLGRAPESALGVPVDLDSKKLDYSLDELERQALQSRPQLLEAALGVERAAGALSLARSEFFPDFMLQYRQRRDSMRGSSQDAMIGFTIPLWFWKPAAMAAEAKSELQMFQAQLQATRLMTLSEVRASFVRARTSQRLIELYRNGVLAQAEGALKVVEASYQADKASFLDLVDGQRAFLNFKLEYYQYIAEYEQRLAELERAVGKELL